MDSKGGREREGKGCGLGLDVSVGKGIQREWDRKRGDMKGKYKGEIASANRGVIDAPNDSDDSR